MNPLFKEIDQICFVVDDIMESIKIFNDSYGIGPWAIMNFGYKEGDAEFNGNAVQIDNAVTDGVEVGTYAAKLAVCNSVSNIQLEIIQPLDEKSTFGKYLKEHGPGVHHISIKNGPFKESLKVMADAGFTPGMTVRIDGHEDTAFVDHMDPLGTFLELHDRGDDFTPPQVKLEMYPPDAKPDF